MTPGNEAGEARKPPRCPICGRPRELRYRPFCSARCRDIDLANWLGGRYAVPAAESEADEEELAPDRGTGADRS